MARITRRVHHSLSSDRHADRLPQHARITRSADAHQFQRSRRDVALVIRIEVNCLPPMRRVRPNHGGPDLFGALYIFAVAVPVVQSAPASVVARDDQCSGIAVRGRALDQRPEVLKRTVQELDGAEHAVVAGLCAQSSVSSKAMYSTRG